MITFNLFSPEILYLKSQTLTFSEHSVTLMFTILVVRTQTSVGGKEGI